MIHTQGKPDGRTAKREFPANNPYCSVNTQKVPGTLLYCTSTFLYSQYKKHGLLPIIKSPNIIPK